ncbi:1-aminocyclopropane-1-carboxylate oxidase-like 1 [Quillaja saponaria]|uniref:1-aminocyclopropane-1-carboxylate oxidase-like 1 n=1 Tax=Quillaja saponaria TaxID=32244 RepID=A0AAD7QEA3_QUISA|nr:1-aminocyclopropane-1-carboxylate oxidase-like 1 [Quillaja saponaria]
MDESGDRNPYAENEHSDYDRVKELKAFDDTKAGVKGLVDDGIVKIPKIFICPPDELADNQKVPCNRNLQVPVIDLGGIRGDQHKKIVDEVRIASESWGFFQVLNHGIPVSVLEDMIKGVREFHEQDSEVKKDFYTRDKSRKFRFHSNRDLYQSKAAKWRDTLTINIPSVNIEPEDLPAVCRVAAIDYINHIGKLGETLSELLSEALDLNPDHLRAMGCTKEKTFVCNYYPACPEPELTLGISKHSDPAFLTILLQNQIGGLQVLHDNHWVDVHPISGALVVNTADILQILSNDKFRSVQHRALANQVGPRISVACFFNGQATGFYGPLKELISEENTPRYKDFLLSEFLGKFFSQGLDDKPVLEYFKV